MSVLITGSSEGIGLALTREYLRDGHHVVMTARDPIRLSLVREELEKTYGTKIFAVSADLTVPEERRKLYEEVKSAGITVDTLINNAGIGFAGVSWETEPENDMRLIRLNDEAVVDLCHMYLPEMIERRSGTVINIASTGAFQPGPYIASYYASKSFVVSYSQAVNYEARPFGVRVIAYCPGPVDTAFYDKSKGKLPPLYMSAGEAASYLYKRRNSSRPVIIAGIINNILRIIPASLKMPILAQLKKRSWR